MAIKSRIGKRRPRGVIRENSRFWACFTTSDTRKDSLEVRMQKAVNVWVKDAKIYRNNNTPWRVRCSRVTHKVHGVFVYGGKKWSWSRTSLDKVKRWEAK